VAKKVVLELTQAEARALSTMAGNVAYSDEDLLGALHNKPAMKAGYRAYEKLKAAIALAESRSER
jgi:hypothetical protein